MDLRFIINTKRRLLKLTAYGLAKRAGVPSRAVYYFLSGESNGNGELIGKLLDAMELVVAPKQHVRTTYVESWEDAAARLPPELRKRTGKKPDPPL